jgi:hypothetical protein
MILVSSLVMPALLAVFIVFGCWSAFTTPQHVEGWCSGHPNRILMLKTALTATMLV